MCVGVGVGGGGGGEGREKEYIIKKINFVAVVIMQKELREEGGEREGVRRNYRKRRERQSEERAVSYTPAQSCGCRETDRQVNAEQRHTHRPQLMLAKLSVL